MADHSETISEIEQLQNEGAQTVSVDGVTVSRNFGELRKRRRELEQLDNSKAARRPRISKVNLGATW